MPSRPYKSCESHRAGFCPTIAAMRKSKTDVWRAASALVVEHGADAGFVARLRADALLKQYDVDGHLLWKRITTAVKELQREKPLAGEWMN